MFRQEEGRRRPTANTTIVPLPCMRALADDVTVNGTERRLTSALYVQSIGDILNALRDPNGKRLVVIEIQRRRARIAATAALVNWPPTNGKYGRIL